VTTKRTQGERLVAIETKLEVLSGDINEIKDSLKEHIAWEESKYNSLKQDYAAKWSEKAIYAIIMILIGVAIKVMVGGI